MTGQEVATVNPTRELVAQVRSEQFQQQVALALPGNVTPARFVRATVTALMQNPDLATADRESVFVAAIKCATDGLLPDGREAALVMFGDKAAYLPMVGGFRKIAADHGWTIRSAVVYEADEFTYELGLEPKLTHRPAPLRTERGQMIAAYAVGSHRDGRREFEVMNAAEIEKVRNVSRAKNSGPWKDWPERMWEKTAARRLFAKLPLDRSSDTRIESLLEASKENAADLLYGPDGTATPARQLPPADARTDAAPEEGGAAEGVPVAPGDETGGQQADEEQPAAADSSPVPGDDDDEEPTLAATFTPPTEAIDKAAATEVPRGSRDVKGKPLSAIAADANGEQWLLWAISKADGYWPANFRGALELFVEHRCSDVWAQYQAKREAA